MILAFTLSMPSNNAWNGKWTGESNRYVRVRNFGRTKKGIEHAQKILENPHYRYSFGDGWVAEVSVNEVTAKEAGRLRKRSQGFCGYDWMIDSIKDCGLIRWPEDNNVA